jgi:hypothetical protein
MTFLKCWASTVKPRKDVPSAHLVRAVRLASSSRQAVLFTHMLAVEKFSTDRFLVSFTYIRLTWRKVLQYTVKNKTLGAVVAKIYETSVLAHDVLIKLVSVR